MTALKHLQRIMNGLLYLAASVLFGLSTFFLWRDGTIMYTDTLAFKYADLFDNTSTVASEMFEGYYFANFATPVLTLVSYLLLISAILFAVAAFFWLLVAVIPSIKASRVFTSLGNIFYHIAFEVLILELICWIISAIAVHMENGNHSEIIHTHAFICLILMITASIAIKILSKFTLRLQKAYEENLAIAQAEAEMNTVLETTATDVSSEEEKNAQIEASSQKTASKEKTEEPVNAEETSGTEESAEVTVDSEEISQLESEASEESATDSDRAQEQSSEDIDTKSADIPKEECNTEAENTSDCDKQAESNETQEETKEE